MALWVNERIAGRAFLRMAYFTPTVLPMIAVANIWLFFYTPQYGLLEQITGALGLPSHNWLGDPSTALGAVTAGGDLEGGRLLHDLLPRGAAVAQPEPARGGGDRRGLALVFLQARAVAAADADHAVRAGQRVHQRVSHGRPPVRADARRPRQRVDPAAVPPVRSGLQFLGHRPTLPPSPWCWWSYWRASRWCSSSCSTARCTTGECRSDRHPAIGLERPHLARHAGRVAARAAVDPAAGLCGVDRVPPGGVLDPVPPAGAAHAWTTSRVRGRRRRSRATS